jgi:hypothetical protein
MKLAPLVLLFGSTAPMALADHDSRAARAREADEHTLLGISLGAGTNGFIGAAARDVIGPGLGWEARVTTLDNRHVRAELSYLGSTQEALDASEITLRTHGLQATLRINVIPTWPVEPFFYIGVGVARLTALNDPTGMFGGTDYVLDNPFGLGGAYHYGRWVFDVRAAISVVTGAQIVTDETMESANLNRFSLRASVGVEL